MDDLGGRVAFVTGGASGIGLGIAKALAKAGSKVAIADIDADALGPAQEELASITDVVAVTLDVRDREAFAAVADDVEQRLGPVSLLFNNAGVAGGVSPAAMSYEAWDWFMGINVEGVYNGIQTFVPRMIQRGGGGHVVNTASGAGVAAVYTGFLYSTTKFAVVGLSESLSQDLAAFGIGVSVLCPGPVATRIIQNTAGLRPVALGGSREVSEGEASAAAFLANEGVAPEAVGDMVLDAIRAGRLHIFTDDVVMPAIEARTAMLLAAQPSNLG